MFWLWDRPSRPRWQMLCRGEPGPKRFAHAPSPAKRTSRGTLVRRSRARGNPTRVRAGIGDSERATAPVACIYIGLAMPRRAGHALTLGRGSRHVTETAAGASHLSRTRVCNFFETRPPRTLKALSTCHYITVSTYSSVVAWGERRKAVTRRAARLTSHRPKRSIHTSAGTSDRTPPAALRAAPQRTTRSGRSPHTCRRQSRPAAALRAARRAAGAPPSTPQETAPV